MTLQNKKDRIKQAYVELFGQSMYINIEKGIDENGWYSNERNDAWLPLQNQPIINQLDFKRGYTEFRPKSLIAINSLTELKSLQK